MKVNELLDHWTEAPSQQLTARKYTARLPVWDAARVSALSELFPARTKTQIMTDLVSAALDDLESKIPYIRGDNVISEDDHGDPIYEDAGLTPKFLDISRAYAKQLQEEAEAARDAKRSGADK
ncbi:MAG: type 1 pili tip component [Gammaproteobacteria bacterium]|nr:type 1 pili tip component [Gammaproteobacteria bacterium]